MTRLLCFADTQIGVGTLALADQRAVLDRIVAIAITEGAEVVVHGGDVFEGPLVTPEQLREFLDATEPLRARGIPLVVLRGNGRHDMAVRPVHALDVLRDIPGFWVSDRPEVIRLAGCAVCTLPWVHPARLLAKMNGGVDHDHVYAGITKILTDAAYDMYEKLGDEPAVLVAHWAISSAKLPNGLSVEELREPVLPWAELTAIGYDLIVGAHIHLPQRLDNPDLDRTPGFVVGSPQQLNFGERGERGCWLVEFGGEQPTWRFIPVVSREFVTLDLDPAEDFANNEVPEGAIVRVRMRLTEQQFLELDQGAIRAQLLDAGAERVRFDLDIERDQRRAVEITEQLSAVDAMALYCDATGVEEPLRSALIDTIRAWEGE